MEHAYDFYKPCGFYPMVEPWPSCIVCRAIGRIFSAHAQWTLEFKGHQCLQSLWCLLCASLLSGLGVGDWSCLECLHSQISRTDAAEARLHAMAMHYATLACAL